MRAFSLIELMVVIAIVAVLAAASIPAYKNYVIKTSIAKSYNILQSLQRDIIQTLQSTGTLPVSMSLLGVTVTNGLHSNITSSNSNRITSLFYGKICTDGVNCGAGNPVIGVWLQADIDYASLGLPVPVERYILRTVSIVGPNSIYRSYCGTWDAAGQEIPSQYLPSNCTCTNLNTIWSNGAVNNPC